MLRNPKSQSSREISIEDKALEPYFIAMPRDGGYVVYKKVKKERKGATTEYNQVVCYPSSLVRSIKVIQRELILDGKKRNYESLEEFITAWRELEVSMDKLIQE